MSTISNYSESEAGAITGALPAILLILLLLKVKSLA